MYASSGLYHAIGKGRMEDIPEFDTFAKQKLLMLSL